MEYTREIKVTVYIDTNKRTHNKEYTPHEGEGLVALLRRLADEYEERYRDD